MKLTVYGTGCPKCRQTEEVARQAAAQAGAEAEIEKVTSVTEIARAGVLFTPALAINGEFVAQGKVPDVAEVVARITSALAAS